MITFTGPGPGSRLPFASRPQNGLPGLNAPTMADDAIKWLTENRPDIPADQRSMLGELLGSISNAAGWRPPTQYAESDEDLHSLPAGASGISEQGGCFVKGDDGLFYEHGRPEPHRAEDIALPFEVHAVYTTDP